MIPWSVMAFPFSRKRRLFENWFFESNPHLSDGRPRKGHIGRMGISVCGTEVFWDWLSRIHANFRKKAVSEWAKSQLFPAHMSDKSTLCQRSFLPERAGYLTMQPVLCTSNAFEWRMYARRADDGLPVFDCRRKSVPVYVSVRISARRWPFWIRYSSFLRSGWSLSRIPGIPQYGGTPERQNFTVPCSGCLLIPLHVHPEEFFVVIKY